MNYFFKIKCIVLIVSSLSCFSFSLLAQSGEKIDGVFLKNKSYIKGTILKVTAEGNITFRLLSGYKIELKKEEILKQKQSKKKYLIQYGDYFFQTKGMYFAWKTELRFLAGFRGTPYSYGNTKYTYGGIQLSTGYQFNNYLSIGLGIGTEVKHLRYVPLFLELKGALTKKRISPIYAFQLGSTFLIKKSSYKELHYERRNLFILPSIGIRFASLRKFNTEFTVGVKSQYTQIVTSGRVNIDYPGYNTPYEVFSVLQNSFVVSLGFVF